MADEIQTPSQAVVPPSEPAASRPAGELSPSGWSPTDPVLSQLERLVTSPSLNLEALDKLWSMSQQRRQELARIEFNLDFAKMAPQLPTVEQSGKIKIYSKFDREKAMQAGGAMPANAVPIQTSAYTKFDDILQAIIPVISEHGFGISFEPKTEKVGESFRIYVTARLFHRSGYEKTADCPPLVHDISGTKNAVQAIGSTLTYAKRYALQMVLPIISHAPEDADDDGSASMRAIIGLDEVAFVTQQLAEKGGNLEQLLERVGAASLETMTADQYRRALEAIEARAKRARR